jgi:hypothetical protein
VRLWSNEIRYIFHLIIDFVNNLPDNKMVDLSEKSKQLIFILNVMVLMRKYPKVFGTDLFGFKYIAVQFIKYCSRQFIFYYNWICVLMLKMCVAVLDGVLAPSK